MPVVVGGGLSWSRPAGWPQCGQSQSSGISAWTAKLSVHRWRWEQKKSTWIRSSDKPRSLSPLGPPPMRVPRCRPPLRVNPTNSLVRVPDAGRRLRRGYTRVMAKFAKELSVRPRMAGAPVDGVSTGRSSGSRVVGMRTSLAAAVCPASPAGRCGSPQHRLSVRGSSGSEWIGPRGECFRARAGRRVAGWGGRAVGVPHVKGSTRAAECYCGRARRFLAPSTSNGGNGWSTSPLISMGFSARPPGA